MQHLKKDVVLLLSHSMLDISANDNNFSFFGFKIDMREKGRRGGGGGSDAKGDGKKGK